MKKNNYDIIVIGLGPAGMAVSIMAAEMGLNVLAVEKNKIGGECMNVGCVPSKALLRKAKNTNIFNKMKNNENCQTSKNNIFDYIQGKIQYISENKTLSMFKKVNLLLGKGEAKFVDSHSISVGDNIYSGKKIFIATGTRPMLPPIPGIETVNYLTNENIFHINEIPTSLTIIGGGAIGVEMAQAFVYLGSKVNIVHMDEYLLRMGDEKAAKLLEETFEQQGIKVLNKRTIIKVQTENNNIVVETQNGEKLISEKLLVAAGRKPVHKNLDLNKAGIKYNEKGILVNNYLQTNKKHVYAIGDCNAHVQLSHSAMHQGMIAIMNSMLPPLAKRNFKKFVVPWTVFTEPQVSHVGLRDEDLKKQKIKYETIEVSYSNYGAAIAEDIATGFLRVYIGRRGKILGASIIGENSGEMINEWGLAIQKNIKIYDIMMLQHSFPTMSFLTKRVAEQWMMGKMNSSVIKKIIKLAFKLS